MLRKVVLGTAATVLLGTFLFGREFFSYARTWGTSVRKAVKKEVPLEFEIQRASDLVQNLVPDIRQCMHAVAELQVEVEDLSRRIGEREQELALQKEAILRLRQDLKSSKTRFTYAGHSYARDEVLRDLARRFERYKVARETLDRERQVLKARQQALEACQRKLENMLAAKKDLEVRLEQLEARLEAIRAAEAATDVPVVDDTRLARAKELIRELNKRLDVREKMLDAEGKFAGLIPVESEEELPVNLTEQIDAYFGQSGEDQTKPARDGQLSAAVDSTGTGPSDGQL